MPLHEALLLDFSSSCFPSPSYHLNRRIANLYRIHIPKCEKHTLDSSPGPHCESILLVHCCVASSLWDNMLGGRKGRQDSRGENLKVN